jgi:hypothetical protein
VFDRVFAAAFIDGGLRTKVLGVKLRPFSPWHLFLLQVIDSPFLRVGEVRLYDLRRAVGVCRLQYPHSKTRPPITLKIMTMKRLEREVLNFLSYISNYLQKPDYGIIPSDLFPRDGGRAPHPQSNPPPEIISLVYDAAKGANISVPDAWNMPIGQAYIAQAMRLIELGANLDFMDEKEREFQALLKSQLSEQAVNGEK